MGVLDEVTKMKQQGYSDDQIIQSLKEKNISPKQISQALDQSNVKTAVDQEQDMQQSIMKKTQEMGDNNEQYSQSYGQYPQAQPPQSQQGQEQEYQQDTTQQDYGQDMQQQNYEQAYPQQEQVYQDGGYQGYEGYGQDMQAQQQYQGYQDYSSMNMSEIAEGVVAEKTQEMKTALSKISQKQNILDNALVSIDERLKRIEKIIDKLEIQIIGKISDYGKNMQDINKEMKTMQSSFSKIINPIIDNKKGIKSTSPKKRKPSKKEDDFERYLR